MGNTSKRNAEECQAKRNRRGRITPAFLPQNNHDVDTQDSICTWVRGQAVRNRVVVFAVGIAGYVFPFLVRV